MPKALTSTITGQRTDKVVSITLTFKINGTDYISYLLPNWTLSYDRKFGAANGIFTLNNSDSRFGEGGANQIYVGDTIELIQQFTGDNTQWKSFYGVVRSRSIEKTASTKNITLVCLDYISVLQDLDIDVFIEGTRVEVTNEELDPVYLEAPNDDLAQLFNFANDSVATKPLPFIRIRDDNHDDNIDAQYDGYEVYYDVGQLKLGSPLNVRNNYTVLANYSYYTKGKYVEDVIEEILKTVDGYGNFLFGDSSAANFVTNHLTERFSNISGSSSDTMTPNLIDKTLTIEHLLAADVTAGATEITLDDTEGIPTQGEGNINGDTFTWTAIGVGNTLTGIPANGSYALNDHSSGDYFFYDKECSPGQAWALSYTNLTDTLTSADFSLPSGVTVLYVDKRYGRIILDTAISIGETITCTANYAFKTLQATGIEINQISFRKREVKSRFDAINKVREYVAPNYVIRTQGDDKIWASYLSQKVNENYTLDLETSINYLEDTDLYTRVVMWGKNRNPENVMFGDEVDYSSDNEDSYTGIAVREELSYFGQEKSGVLSAWATALLNEAVLLHMDEIEQLINYIKELYIDKDYPSQEATGLHIFGTPISDRGKIILGDVIPIVYINDVPIDNSIHQQVGVPIRVRQTTETITEGGGKSKGVSVHTYYYYEVIFPHTSLVPSEVIYLYDSQGILQYTLAANDPNMNYSEGVWTSPGIEQNSIIESLSTATYNVLYSTEKVIIDYENVIFKIDNSILPNPEEVIVRASFEYWAIAIVLRDIDAVVDGRRDTQLQVEFFGEPPSGFHLATIDLGSTYPIQALDIVGGFFKPDEYRRFDMGCRLSLQYSTNGTDFYAISDKTENFTLGSGEAVSFEETDLGTDFETRYLKFNLDEVDRINYGRGRYVVSITEISAYKNIIIEAEATLIATTALTQAATTGDTTVHVFTTEDFTEPESGETSTAYIDEDSFTYTGLTATTFTGCDISSGVAAISSTRVSQTIEADTTLYDTDSLLPQLGDRVYKSQKISDRNLYSQSELDTLAKNYLKEFYKNHSKVNVNVVFAPYLQVGQTVKLTDTYNDIDDNYFVESIKTSGNLQSLVLAKYP